LSGIAYLSPIPQLPAWEMSRNGNQRKPLIAWRLLNKLNLMVAAEHNGKCRWSKPSQWEPPNSAAASPHA